MRPDADWGRETRRSFAVCYTWGEHSTPHKPCVGSPEISQEAERVRKNTAESPAVSAGGNWWGGLSRLRIGWFESFQRALGHRDHPSVSGTWPWVIWAAILRYWLNQLLKKEDQLASSQGLKTDSRQKFKKLYYMYLLKCLYLQTISISLHTVTPML